MREIMGRVDCRERDGNKITSQTDTFLRVSKPDFPLDERETVSATLDGIDTVTL